MKFEIDWLKNIRKQLHMNPELHNIDYDFPDEILKTGVNMFYQIIKNIQGIKRKVV